MIMLMPYRIIPFVNGHIYHIYNRGVQKHPIFFDNWDRGRFLEALQYYQFSGPKPRFSIFRKTKIYRTELKDPLVKIVAYCLMPNHFHLLIQQISEGGITEFVSKLSNSYTKYINTKYDFVGPLLQGEFKAVLVESDEQLMHVNRYIHLNPVSALMVRDLTGYKWSSYPEYIDDNHSKICYPDPVLELFPSKEKYKEFIKDQSDYILSLESILKHVFDEEK